MHEIQPRQVGKYTICARCLRGMRLQGTSWKHIVRTRWTAS